MRFDVPSRCSLLLIGQGEDEVYAIQGRLEAEDGGHVFNQHSGGGRVPMEPEWLERAKPVTQDLESIFGAASQFFIPLSVGDLPMDANGNSLSTGIRLPTGDGG
jgi:hypothetical protein